jgi:hypothetical protein
MKYYKILTLLLIQIGISGLLVNVAAQDSTEAVTKVKAKPVKNTFESNLLMDNQTVMVPVKGTMEMVIQHRFGTIENGSEDLFGLWAPSNIRMGLNYAIVKNLYAGAGITKERAQLDLNAKYALLHETPGTMPVSVTLFGEMAIDTRNKRNFRYGVDRLSYFGQLMIAKKLTERFSVQVSPTISWFNNVEAYVDSKGIIQSKMHNYHFGFSTIGRYRITDKSAVTVGYDQPLTQHVSNNPEPNISFGFETNTSSHSFQVFAGTYYSIVPQRNNMFNENDYRKSQFVIGFNIIRLWNF